MSISNSMLLSAIRGLEDAVYYKDCRGRYASLPDNNSMRIDLLSGRLEELAKIIEDNIGGDLPEHIRQIVKYLDGSTDPNKFPESQKSTYGDDIIEVDNVDEGRYTNIQESLQNLYNNRGSSGNTGIVYDANVDKYNYVEDTLPPTYQNDITQYPNIFPYIYKELNYILEHLFERTNEFNVYKDMTTGFE